MPHVGTLGRLLHRESAQAARVAAETRLATTWPVLPSWTEISALCHQFYLSPSASLELSSALFRQAYERFVVGDAIGAEERDCLDRLRTCLNVGEDAALRVEHEVTEPRFDAIVRDALSEFDWQRSIRSEFDAAAERLWLSHPARDRVYAALLPARLQAEFNVMIANRRVSPDAFLQFGAKAKSLGIQPQFDAPTETLLHRFAALWRIDHGDLPRVNAPIRLAVGEVCHFTSGARWLEQRRTTRTVGYINRGVSIRVARGVYYRTGTSTPSQVVQEGLATVDEGSAILTSKRLIFTGAVRNFTIKLDAIIAFQVFSDGVAIEKAAGKHPHLMLGDETEIAAAILGALLASA